MRTILFLIQKEFLQVFRNKSMLPIIFVVPVVQLLILVNAATLDMKNIKAVFVNQDNSSFSNKITSSFSASPFFKVEGSYYNLPEAEAMMREGKTDMILVIPQNFEKDIYKEGKAKVQLIFNAINGTTAGIGSAYSNAIISSTTLQVSKEMFGENNGLALFKTINVNYSYWYNPEMNYKTFMVPAVLVLLVTVIGFFLGGLNVVREKEMGTIEQINVTPIKKYQFIIGKLFPFWVIALIELTIGLIVGKLVFNIPIVGNIGLVYLAAAIYLLVVLGLGLFMSTITHTQQQAMLLSFFFVMIFVMMSGVFTSVESMPEWAQKLDLINPIYYFMRIIRMVLLKGSELADIKSELYSLLVYATAVISLSVWRYKKTS